jgi:hypothetical protein
VTLTWTAIGVSLGVILLATVWSRLRAPKAADHGVISDQWLAEHRNGPLDSQR